MAKLKEHQSMQTTDGENLEIVSQLGEGGQGVVYKVLFRGGEYALKWYSHGVENSDLFYRNLQNNIRAGSPAPTFLWPLAITQKDKDGCFGYVMALRTDEYKDFDAFLLNRVQFKTFTAIVNAAMQIVASFRLLHNKGLSYQDLNDGNFFINPDNGDILICDNDNVAPDGDNLGIKGKPKYMAPEIVSQKCRPDTASDRFSLAVVLFMLMFHGHPLEGQNDRADTDPDKNEMNLYCNNPVFIYDPGDESNRPDPALHRNVIMFWSVYPDSIKSAFARAFEKSRMKNDDSSERQDRVIEKEWLKTLAVLRTQIIQSPCCEGEETFFDAAQTEHLCMNCDKPFEAPPLLKVHGFDIPLQAGRKIHQYEVDDVEIELSQLNNVVAEVIANKIHPDILGIRNLGEKPWTKTTPAGKVEVIEQGKVVPVARGISIRFPSRITGIIV